MKKRITAFLLAFVMITGIFCSIGIVSSADDGTEEAGETVAELYLCVAPGPHGVFPLGHAWVCIKNVSGEVLYIGEQAIEPDEMISAGLYYYNGMTFGVEMSNYSGTSVKALEYDLTAENFSRVSDEILKDEWGTYEIFTHNCATFAVAVWKTATGESFFTFCFPFVVYMQMKDAVSLAIA